MCSKERIVKIKRRMEKIPKWDDETYQIICNKHNIFLSLHHNFSEFCESKVTNVNDLQKELDDMQNKIVNELTYFTTAHHDV